MLTAPQYHAIAQALQSLPEDHPVWAGLQLQLADSIKEANEMTTDMHQPDRDWWAGYERGRQDLREELGELRDGRYREWPAVKLAGAEAEEQDPEPD